MAKLLVWVVCAGALGLARPASAAMAYGMGALSCAEWTEEAPPPQTPPEKQSWARYTYTAWVGGYLTALNSTVSLAKGDIMAGSNIVSAFAWVDNYCASHPLDMVGTAVDRLSVELLKRRASAG